MLRKVIALSPNVRSFFAVITLFSLAGSFLYFSRTKNPSIVKNDGVLVVGTSLDYPPFESISGHKPIGFDIDLIEKISEHLGKKITIKNIDFHGLIPSLVSGNVDVVICALTPTDERKKVIDFSIPYHTASLALLSKKTSKFEKMNQLKHKRIGVQLSSFPESVARTDQAEHGYRITALARLPELIEELKNGGVDALLVDEKIALSYVEHHQELFVAATLPYCHYDFAIAVEQGSKLVHDIDTALIAFKSNGVLEDLENKWFKKESE